MAGGESFAPSDKAQTQNQPVERDAAAMDKLRVDLINQGSGGLFNKIANDMSGPSHDSSLPSLTLFDGQYVLGSSDSSNTAKRDTTQSGSGDALNGGPIDGPSDPRTSQRGLQELLKDAVLLPNAPESKTAGGGKAGAAPAPTEVAPKPSAGIGHA